MKRVIAVFAMVLFSIISLNYIFSEKVFAADYYDSFYAESSWNGLSLSDNKGGDSGCDSNITYRGQRNITAGDLFTCAWLRSDKGDRGHSDDENDIIMAGKYATEFYIDLQPGKICKQKGYCRQHSRFLCIKDFSYLTVLGKIYIDDADTPKGGSNDYYYFLVTFEPGNHPYSSNPQTVAGLIRVHKNALTPTYSFNVRAREDDRYLDSDVFSDTRHSFPVIEDGIFTASVKSGDSVTLKSWKDMNNNGSVDGNEQYAGYTWEMWGQGSGETCKSAYQNRTCTLTSVTSGDSAVNAYYVRNRFEGRIRAVLNGEEIGSTGYVGRTQSTNTDIVTKNVTIEDCGGGCDVDFEFNLRNAAGNGSTVYKLAKQVNGGSWSWKFGDGKTEDWKNGDSISSELTHINPGDTVCWYMSYHAIAGVTEPSTDAAKYGKVKVCVGVEAVGFEGKIEVSGSTSGVVGYTMADDKQSYFIENCPSAGCQVNFSHSIKRSGGNNATVYSVSRDSNLDSKVGDMGLTDPKNTSGGQVYSDSMTMYPGMRVCEKLKFVPDIRRLTQFANLEACVLAKGTADSSIDIKARNENVGAYDSWQDSEVYAKPNDKIGLKGIYTPRYQYAYELMADSVKINGDVAVEQNWKGDNLRTIFNENINPGWNNAFSVDLFNDGEKSDLWNDANVFTRVVGQDGPKEETLSGNNAYTVSTGDVGKTALVARAETNGVAVASTTPKSIDFSYTNGRYGYSTNAVVDTGSISDDVSVRVPYNFINTTAVTSSADSTKVPAGGQVEIKFNYSINPKPNSKTTNGSDQYATKVDNAKYKLKYCFGADCDRGIYTDRPESTSTSYDVGLNQMQTGRTIPDLSQTIPIPDVEAGTKLCVKSSVYPANSGADDNYNNPNGSNTWADSAKAVCFKVGKQPNFQVWGGNVYSEKKIDLPQTTKTFDREDVKEERTFGSWVELGLVAKGKVTGLASGAGLGYDGLELDANPGGSNKSGFCAVSTLSFTNTECNNGAVGGAGEARAVDLGIDLNDEEKLKGDGWAVVKQEVPLCHFMNQPVGDDGISVWWYGRGQINYGDCYTENVDPSRVDKVLWRIDGDATINMNLKRSDNGKNSWDDVGKLIIYAENIKIDCKVKQIDAVLIARRNIDTCYNTSYGLDSSERSTPLRINGVIIADTLTLGRTYGAGKGTKSIVPAEVINYDVSLYSWAINQPGSGSGDGLTEAYTSELAPRY